MKVFLPMPEPIGEHNLHQHLTAFADGELDDAQTLALLDYLAAHPDVLGQSVEMMRDQQRLRLTARRLLREQAPPLSAATESRVEQLSSTVGGTKAGEGKQRRWIARWLPPIAAFVLALVAGMLLVQFALRRPEPKLVVGEPASVVPVALVASATHGHAECARLAEELHSMGYAREYAGLAEAVKRDLSGPNPYPDLSSIGYRFVGAGPCPDPMPGTVHLLYRQPGPVPQANISILVQPNDGQFSMAAGKVYEVSGPRSAFPMYVWRTDRVVYFLVADDGAAAMRALRVISTAPKP